MEEDRHIAMKQKEDIQFFICQGIQEKNDDGWEVK